MEARAGVWLSVRGLRKAFGPVVAVDDVSFDVAPGRVTGFLGPNGAGKTTTLRCLLGLMRPTAGEALVAGVPYARLERPLHTVGAALEASSFHPGRSARAHLRYLAEAARLPSARVGEVLAQVGLEEYADRRVGGYSQGMRQRLALAQALLGDPPALVLDEPANGLDPAGIAWLRGFLRSLAAEGRTVLVSSHVLAEVQQTVDDVVVLARGRVVASGVLAELESGRSRVLAKTPTPDALRVVLTAEGVEITEVDGDAVRVRGEAAHVGHLAFVAGVELHELREEPGDLERLFLELTGGAE